MAFIVVYDAGALYPAPVRDLLLRIATGGLVRARWTHRILDEGFRSIAANRPDLPSAALARTRDLMCAAVPDCLVADFEGLESAVNAISLRPGAVIQAITQQAAALKSPPISIGELLDILRDRGLEQSVAQLRELFGTEPLTFSE